MKIPNLFSSIISLLLTLTLPFTLAESRSNTIHIRYNTPPFKANTLAQLAEIHYTVHDNGTTSASLGKWSPPPADTPELRIGLTSFSAASGFLKNPVSVSMELLRSPEAVLQVMLDASMWEPIGVGLGKGGSGGEGEGPEVRLLAAAAAPVPAVNKPVVLSAEGKVQEPPAEKTLLQKYWWVLLAITFMVMSGGGGGGDGK